MINYFYEKNNGLISATGGDYVYTHGDHAPGLVVQVGLTDQTVDSNTHAVAIT